MFPILLTIEAFKTAFFIICWSIESAFFIIILPMIETAWKMTWVSELEKIDDIKYNEKWNSRRRKSFRRSKKVRNFKHKVKDQKNQKKDKFYYKKNVGANKTKQKVMSLRIKLSLKRWEKMLNS